MAKNRLNLNFQLESAEDRTQFVRDYLEEIDFVPTEAELETISNYILWGKDQSGKNPQQRKEIEIKPWTAPVCESIEGLMETPGFQETNFRELTSVAPRIPRVVFSRSKAIQDAPDYLKEVYNDLFRQIDTLELMINYYELFAGKRKLPPRESLVGKFNAEQQEYLNEQALKLSQFKYLKLRHLLIELRREQYTIKDNYAPKVSFQETNQVEDPFDTLLIGEDVTVLPIGIKYKNQLCSKIFVDGRDPIPSDFTSEDLAAVSKMLWVKPTQMSFDFRNTTHLLAALQAQPDLEDEIMKKRLLSNAEPFLNTLKFYESRAELTELQQKILDLKLKKVSNQRVAQIINETYDKSYNDNYISTIFHQKIIPQIAEAASYHREVMESIFYPTNFKKCKDCGRVLLASPRNFVRQKKSNDGFSPRCKKCEKIKREIRNKNEGL